MKAKLYIAIVVAFIMVCFCSCNPSEIIIKEQIRVANKSCPMNVGNGLTLTSVKSEGRYVVYNYEGDESIYTFSNDLVTNSLKNEVVSELKTEARTDTKTELFLNALIKSNVGIIYHYYTGSSFMYVVIEASDLARDEEIVEETVEVVVEEVVEEVEEVVEEE